MIEKKFELTSIDKKIVSFLAKNGRMRDNELAKVIGVSDDTIRRHREKLEAEGFFKIEAVFNTRKFGYTTSYQLGLVLTPGVDTRATAEKLSNLEPVHFVVLSLGPTHSIIANCRSKNPLDLNRLVEELRKWKEIERIDVNIIYDAIKNRLHNLPDDALGSSLE